MAINHEIAGHPRVDASLLSPSPSASPPTLLLAVYHEEMATPQACQTRNGLAHRVIRVAAALAYVPNVQPPGRIPIRVIRAHSSPTRSVASPEPTKVLRPFEVEPTTKRYRVDELGTILSRITLEVRKISVLKRLGPKRHFRFANLISRPEVTVDT